MSYARFGPDSDVYVYLDVGGYLNCCGCRLLQDGRFFDTASMIAHLAEHSAAGHVVPDGLVAELRADTEENDEWMHVQAERR